MRSRVRHGKKIQSTVTRVLLTQVIEDHATSEICIERPDGIRVEVLSEVQFADIRTLRSGVDGSSRMRADNRRQCLDRGDDRRISQVMRTAFRSYGGSYMTDDVAAVDSGIEVMDGCAYILRFAIHQRPEIRSRSAIVGRKTEVQIDDLSGKRFDDALSQDAAAEYEDEFGLQCAHRRKFTGCIDSVGRQVMNDHVPRQLLITPFFEVLFLGTIACVKMLGNHCTIIVVARILFGFE